MLEDIERWTLETTIEEEDKEEEVDKDEDDSGDSYSHPISLPEQIHDRSGKEKR
jgi:hypothetical protein